jgi:NAD(P)-dependent dehydrogenase (short-subunit alcohol dehydrogenase family)
LTVSEQDGLLKDQVAVVTGGGRGIGRVIAETLAGEGAKVAVLSRNEKELAEVVDSITAQGGEALAVTADVTDLAQVEAASAKILDQFDHVDLLVNNAGTNLALGLPWEVDPTEWWTDVETSLLGVFLTSRVLGAEMVERGSGRIINISSGAATEPRPYSSGYTAVKTAAQRYTESVAPLFLEHGVKVFSLNPGPVKTTLTDAARNSETGRPFAGTPDGQGDGSKVAEQTVFLASGQGDALTGRYLSVFVELEDVLADERLADPHFLTLRVEGWKWVRATPQSSPCPTRAHCGATPR